MEATLISTRRDDASSSGAMMAAGLGTKWAGTRRPEGSATRVVTERRTRWILTVMRSTTTKIEIEKLVAQRLEAKFERDYATADAIREQLQNEYDVKVDDRNGSGRSAISRSAARRT